MVVVVVCPSYIPELGETDVSADIPGIVYISRQSPLSTQTGLDNYTAAQWSSLIGRDLRDTLLSLVELYYASAKVYAITTHRKGFG